MDTNEQPNIETPAAPETPAAAAQPEAPAPTPATPAPDAVPTAPAKQPGIVTSLGMRHSHVEPTFGVKIPIPAAVALAASGTVTPHALPVRKASQSAAKSIKR